MYKLSHKIRICDDTWNASITEVVSRYVNIVILLCVAHLYLHRMPGAHNHRFVLNFMKTVGNHYVKDGCPHDFILDLLGINVPQLFGLPKDTDKGYPVAVEVQSEFSAFIQSYIHRNALNHFLFVQVSVRM